jgi:C-terminal processing protease CtpA/Prc
MLKSGMLRLFFAGILTGFLSDPSIAQHPEIYLQPTALKRDLVWLQRKILLYHPACRDSLRYDSVNAAFETAFYEAEKPMQELPFLLLLRRTLSVLRCGHSVAIPSKSFYRYYEKARPRPFFPLQVNSHPEGVKVRFNGSDDPKIKIGDRIAYLNQELMEDLQKELLQILPADGYHNGFRHYHLSLDFPTYYLFLRGPYYYFETTLQDTSGKIRTKTLSLRSQTKIISKARTNRSCKLLLRDGQYRDLSIVKTNASVGCLRISRFKGKVRWYRKAFQKLEEAGVKTLILDLRGNPGGNLMEANGLLAHLLPDTFSMRFIRRAGRINFNGRSNLGLIDRFNLALFRWLPSRRSDFGGTSQRSGESITTRYTYKPLNQYRYRGNLIVLMDGGTFSSASYVAAQLRKKGRALLAGEESGGAARGCNAILIPTVTLPETKLQVSLPLYFLDHEKGDPDFRGLIPDLPVPPADPAVFLSGLDPVLEHLAQLSTKENRKK